MTISEMHILFEIEFYQGDTNIRKRIIPETIDKYLNLEIGVFVANRLSSLTKPEESRDFDVIEYYASLSSLITEMPLIPFYKSPGEVQVSLPKGTQKEISSGTLVCGFQYVVTCESENADLSGLETLTEEGYNKVGTDIKLGDTFTLTANAIGIDGDQVEPGYDFNWDTLKVKPIKDYDFLRYIVSTSNTSTTCNLSNTAHVYTSGNVTANREYVITKNLGQANFKGWGASCNDVGTKFIPTANQISNPSPTIVWTGGQLTLSTFIKSFENELLKPQQYVRTSDHAYNVTQSKPICYIMGDRLILRHDNKFDINLVNLMYIRKPAKVDYFANISCDVNEEYHEDIVKAAVQRYLAVDGSQTYQVVAGENAKDKQEKLII